MDVKNALLNGVLDKEVYMYIPDGMSGKEKLQSEYVCALKKSRCGLKLGPERYLA